MRAEDIQSYKDLESYMKLQIAEQTLKRRTVGIELPEQWFFKCAKLIQFTIRDNQNEKFRNVVIAEDCKRIVVKVNKIFTVITRK